MCNYWANRLCCEAADRAMQVHGGLGYSRHKPFEHIYRHHRRYRITEGAEEIQMRRVAGYMFGFMKPTRPEGRERSSRRRVRNLLAVPSDWRETARRLGVRPLSARSLVLSTLLGSHPPRLPGPALVAVGALFDLGPGTMRTAVSRMVADGELVAVGGGQFELGAGAARPPATAGCRARGPPRRVDG